METTRFSDMAALTHRISRRSLLKNSFVFGLSVPVVGALMTACGSSGSKATNTTTGSAAVTKTSGGGAAGTPTSAAGGKDHTVNMTDAFKFDPATLTVKVGDTVTWKNTGTMPHSSTCDPTKAADKSHVQQPDGGDSWDSGILNGGQSYSHTFKVAGDYTYFCIPHESLNMIAKITVTA